MSGNDQSIKIDVKMDQDNLYLEESFTDLRAGSIRRLTPVMPDGLPDKKRKIFFMAQTQLMTQAGLIPIQCEIEAQTLNEAIEKFPAAVNDAVEKLVQRANEMRREEASRIIVPGSEMRNIHLK